MTKKKNIFIYIEIEINIENININELLLFFLEEIKKMHLSIYSNKCELFFILHFIFLQNKALSENFNNIINDANIFIENCSLKGKNIFFKEKLLLLINDDFKKYDRINFHIKIKKENNDDKSSIEQQILYDINDFLDVNNIFSKKEEIIIFTDNIDLKIEKIENENYKAIININDIKILLKKAEERLLNLKKIIQKEISNNNNNNSNNDNIFYNWLFFLEWIKKNFFEKISKINNENNNIDININSINGNNNIIKTIKNVKIFFIKYKKKIINIIKIIFFIFFILYYLYMYRLL